MKLKDGDLMTTADTAETLGVSAGMVTKLRQLGRLPGVKTVGGQWIYRAVDVTALREKRRRAPRGNTLGAVRVPPP